MATSSFKSFGYPFQTANVRVGMDASFIEQQQKANSDIAKVELLKEEQIRKAKRAADLAQENMAARSFRNKNKFVM